MRGLSVVLTGAMVLVLSVGSYALGRKTGTSEPRPASPQDSLAGLEQQLAERVDQLDRRVATLTVMQSSVSAPAAATAAPQAVVPQPDAPIAAEPKEEPFETPESIVAFDAAQRLVDDAIANRTVWDEAHRDEFHSRVRGLTRAQLQSVMSALAVALNTGKLQATAFPPL